ncbi:MAG: HAMP domain-containing sensor histidine kinase [Gemmatimonadaceae bacterium]|nr:HAMP domain-containing sensor histidine kinase [Gemmatimonadaceae bacterium]
MSLRLRLAMWYAGLSVLVVAVACIYSYAVHNRTHYDELDRVIHETAIRLADELAEAPGARALILGRPVGSGVRLLNERGETLFQSSAAADAPLIDLQKLRASTNARAYAAVARIAPSIHDSGTGRGWFGLVYGQSGERYRVFVIPVEGGDYLALTTPLSRIDRAMQRFAILMLAIGAAGGVAAFGAGWAIAGRALYPVAALTESAATIARSREFSRRVAESSSRDELGRLSRTFNAMLASLEAAYDSQVRFVSAASHELRAPLTVVQANLDLLQSRELSEDDRAISVREALRESERMARLVADLLVLARADAGVPIRRESVELDRVVLDVLNETRHLTRGQRVELTHLEPGTVLGDPDRLKQLFLNVVENAIKYTGGRGRISVEIRRMPGSIEVAVSDEGIGIHAEELPRVFDRFFRADAARMRDPAGSGLGLSIAHWVATEHGGSISLKSSPGEGTTVRIRLPAGAA